MRKKITKAKLKEVGLWENWFFRLSQHITRWFFGNFIKYWCGYTCYGVEKLKDVDHCIFAPTHFSHLDFWAVLQDLPKPLRETTYIGAARDHFYLNPVRYITTKMGSYHNFPFDRQVLTPSGYRRIINIVRAGCSLLMFPQGTRSRDNHILPFRPLLAMVSIESNVPIIPVLVMGTHEALPPGKFWIRRKPIKVYFGDPISSDTLNNMERKQLPKKARALNEQVMQVINEMVKQYQKEAGE